MIAISTTAPTATIEQLQEQLRKQLEALEEIGNAELNAFSALSAVLDAYKQADLSPEYFENFADRLIECFPPEMLIYQQSGDGLDNRVAEESGDRITELESDIDGLLVANKNAQYEISCLKDELTAARAAHAQIEKVLLADPVKQQVKELEVSLFMATSRANELHKYNNQLCRENEELEKSVRQKSLPAGEEKFKVGDRVIWFGSEGEIVSTREIRGKIEFSIKTEKGIGYANTDDLEMLIPENSTNEEAPEKSPSTELIYVTPEIAYLKLKLNDQVLSVNIGFVNGKDLSSAKIRAKKWMYHMQEFYGVPSEATELRASKRLKDFDYEIKISQKHCGKSLMSLLNELSRCNFSVYPLEDKGVQLTKVTPALDAPADNKSSLEVFEEKHRLAWESGFDDFDYFPVEPFDDDAPQYKVFHGGGAIGSIFKSYGKDCWKISGDSTEFATQRLAAEELVKRSILPTETESDDAAF